MNTIYKIINKINNKIYIGQTWYPIERRFDNHNRLRSCPHLYSALKYYGRENFVIEAIDFAFTQSQADCLEINYIAQYNSNNNKIGYNIRSGGSHGLFPESECVKRSERQIGNKNHRFGKKNSQRWREANLAVVKSIEFKEKMREICGNKTWKIINGKRVWMEKI